MDVGEFARYVVLFTTFLCVLEISGFLYVYLKVLMPIRHELGDKVIAPPILLTSAYQILVGLLMFWVSVGIVIRIRQGIPVTWSIYPTAVVTVALTVVIGKFYTHYRHRLTAFRAQQDSERLTAADNARRRA